MKIKLFAVVTLLGLSRVANLSQGGIKYISGEIKGEGGLAR